MSPIAGARLWPKPAGEETADAVACPPSATHGVVGLCGLLALVVSIFAVRWHRPFDQIAYVALVVMAGNALGVFLPDLLWQKVHRRTLGDARTGDLGRSLTKFTGLLGSMGFVALLYWVFPEYKLRDSFYGNYWRMLEAIVPVWIALALPYLYWIDRRMAAPQDALWQMGRLVTLRWQGIVWPAIGQHLAGWLVKGFFLPLMFTYMCNDLGKMLGYDFASLGTFQGWYDFLYFALYFFDVSLVSMTYLMSLRLTDTQIRSTEPTALGWATALACYQPFWSLISHQYLDYEGSMSWGAWFGSLPWAYGLWGTAIIGLTAIYLWATVAFGGRFSNLTHRGIITNGPYRYSKHPAYLAKNLSWWMISMPFMAGGPIGQSLRQCLLLLMLNGIYYLRAKTEERHLLLDPDYERYVRWIDAHGLLRFVNRAPILGRLARWRLRFGDSAGRAGVI